MSAGTMKKKGQAKEVKGNVKEAVGRVTGNDRMKASGRANVSENHRRLTVRTKTTSSGVGDGKRAWFFTAGAATIFAGLMVIGVVVGGGTTSVSAQIATATATPTATATAAATNTPTSAEKTATATAETQATETAVVVGTKTAAARATQTASNFTSTPTATDVPTGTSIPATQPAAATPTKTGGAAGSGLKPPNTGTGSGTTNYTPWLVSIGALLVVIGGGSVFTGARRRS